MLRIDGEATASSLTNGQLRSSNCNYCKLLLHLTRAEQLRRCRTIVLNKQVILEHVIRYCSTLYWFFVTCNNAATKVLIYCPHLSTQSARNSGVKHSVKPSVTSNLFDDISVNKYRSYEERSKKRRRRKKKCCVFSLVTIEEKKKEKSNPD